MANELEQNCRELVAELGLANPEDVLEIAPLTGGVASDIARVDLGDRRICMKFALPKLKVSAEWQAPVHRNAAEYAWLDFVASQFPENAVQLFGKSETLHGFAMEFLEGDQVYLWKTNLLTEASDQGEAERVADLLGRIHALSSRQGFDRSAFGNKHDFHALRIEPYLVQTARAHPELAGSIKPLEDMLFGSDKVLVHGDASPKNILLRNKTPILLDAECATMGDASFDPSFCMNHLLLKAIHLPASRRRLLGDVVKFWTAYAHHVTWEDPESLEVRVCKLLPVLMLARIDGKSPVEYLTDKERGRVRDLSIPLISSPKHRVADLLKHVTAKLGD